MASTTFNISIVNITPCTVCDGTTFANLWGYHGAGGATGGAASTTMFISIVTRNYTVLGDLHPAAADTRLYLSFPKFHGEIHVESRLKDATMTLIGC